VEGMGARAGEGGRREPCGTAKSTAVAGVDGLQGYGVAQCWTRPKGNCTHTRYARRSAAMYRQAVHTGHFSLSASHSSATQQCTAPEATAGP
jgi:hypothetical protein